MSVYCVIVNMSVRTRPCDPSKNGPPHLGWPVCAERGLMGASWWGENTPKREPGEALATLEEDHLLERGTRAAVQ